MSKNENSIVKQKELKNFHEKKYKVTVETVETHNFLSGAIF